MEDGDGGDLTPFWVQSATNGRRADRLRRRVSAAFFSSGLVVFLLLVTAVFFLFFVVPSSISFGAQIFKPNSVKKSWDSLNVLLVLVAVVFGFLSRNKNEEKYNSYYEEFQASPKGPKSNLSNSSQWYDYSDYETKLEHKNSILARNSNSYPDLRDFSTTHWSYGDYYQRRYYDDDIHVDSGRDPGQVKLHRRHRSLEGVEHLRALPQNKTVIVDTLLSKYKEGEIFPPPETAAAAVSPPDIEESAATGSEQSSTKLNKDFEPLDPVTAQKLPHPPPVESPEFTENPELTYERGGRRKERSSRKRNKELGTKDPVTTPPPQSDPTPPSPPRQPPSHTPPPPPAPPPPPPSVFQTLFLSKKQKRKRTITVTLAPQSPSPPLEPPPPAAAREPEPTSQTARTTSHKPPKPMKMTSFDRLEEISNSGGDSPLNRIPPPPPPPPPAFFKGPAWKFVVQGDYVRVNSSTSSRSGSPDTDDGESDVTPSAVDAGGAAPFHPSPLFCPSPDVDTKAESFITNFRAKLKLEKIHSMRKKDVGLSGLGPGPGPSQFSQRN
ncbi:hypothetical protein PHJA_001012400 [Phtheirospermum japonicum]|uniref:Uncharacterized protein n=1 Tax=Phtheirospermum japonicum TaxID=374723 RepID=A0A830BMB6_9LAMI|nr:hypothetical protein PHJA_001012400 [Phtheirospermum japonicum]